MHRRFRIPWTLFPRGRLSGRHPLLCRRALQPPSSAHSLFFFVFLLSIIDSQARHAAPSTSFSRCNGAETRRNRRTRYQFRPHFAPLLPIVLATDPIPFPSSFLVTLFFYQFSRANPFCALHLLITNDKFALRLHWWDRTEANSRCRKCILGHTVHPASLFPRRRPVPLIQNFKNKSTRVSRYSGI